MSSAAYVAPINACTPDLIDVDDETPDFTPFADLLEPGDLPVFGFRVLVRIGDDGQMHLDHAHEGEKIQGYLMVGAVMGAMLELFHDHLHEHGDT